MINENLNAKVYYDNERGGTVLHLYTDDRTVLTGKGWKKVPRGETIPDPIIIYDEFHTGLQKLMDGLWKHGIRPSEGTNSTHLQDMRKLVSKAFKVEL